MTATRTLHAPHATKIEYKNIHFLILDQPNEEHIDKFIEECRKHNVTDLVRVCEPAYDKKLLEEVGIRVHDFEFEDGSPPPEEVIEKWLALLRERFTVDPECCVGVHCRAGLGRAPALVSLALIELGMPYDQAIEMIRERRKGSLNAKQIQFMKNYRSRRRLRIRRGSARVPGGDRCAIL